MTNLEKNSKIMNNQTISIEQFIAILKLLNLKVKMNF